MKKFFKKNLLAGLLVVLPIGLTYFIFSFVIRKMDGWMAPLISNAIVRWQLPLPEDFYLPGLGFFLVLSIIFAVGLVGTNFFGRRLVQIGDFLMHNTPFVRGIYTTIKKVMDTISQSDTVSFEKLALVRYPHESVYMLGLVACDTKGEVLSRTENNCINVFLPTLPNVTVGFMAVVPRDRVTLMNMTVEQGMKYLLSFGIVAEQGGNDKADPSAVKN